MDLPLDTAALAPFRSGRVLVVGLGGGCDAVTAHVAAKRLPPKMT